jgi:biotin carboxylase
MAGSRSDIVVVVSDEGFGGLHHFAKTIRDRGFSPLLITPPGPEHWEAAWMRCYDQLVHCDDPYDWGTLVNLVRAVANGRKVRGMFTAYDGVMISTARAARSLGLACPMIPGLERARDKHATRVWTARAGLRTPPFSLIQDAGQAPEVAERVGLPAVIKPLNGTASHLVRRVETPGELRLAYDTLADQVGRTFARHYRRLFMTAGIAGRFDPTRTFLVERFVSGPEYSADIIVRQGVVEHVVLLEKFLVDPVHFHEHGFLWPPALSAESERAIKTYIDDVVHAIGVDNAIAHVEVINSPEGPVLVEINAGRLGGLQVGPLAYAASGVDLAEETLNLALGSGPAPRRADAGGDPVAGLTLFLPAPGRVEAVHGLRELEALPGVAAVWPMCQAGDDFPAADHQIPAVGVVVSGIADRGELTDLYRRMREIVGYELAAPAVG